MILIPGQSAPGNNFLDAGPGAISGSVFEDINGDGTFDPEDTNGLVNVTLMLLDTNGATVQTTQTDASGAYVFTNLAPGTWRVVETDPAGFSSTGDTDGPNDNEISVLLIPGQSMPGNNFLDAGPGAISGSVFEDIDGDGSFDPEDTNGLVNVTLMLIDTNGATVQTTQTDASGAYLFTNLAPATWRVVETDPPGFVSTGDTEGPNDNEISVLLIPGQTMSGNNFLDAGPGSIAGSVFDDVDGDGVFDPEDTNGLVNAAMSLLDTNSMVVQTTLTDASGAYVFTNLAPGTWRVVETDPAGFLSTGDTVGPNDNEVTKTSFL
ncbi:MAG: SdrD B-like domain-containing protein [Verrucomicrobiota bacterium]